jgi:hypothetical protein
MKNPRLTGALCTFVLIFTAPQAKSLTIDTYFGWNYISSNVYDGAGQPINLPELNLNSITYIGANGETTQAMPDFPSVTGMPDSEGLLDNPTFTTVADGDGETTRTVSTSLPIDWIEAGILTPWGSTYSIPTISITGITAFGVPGNLTTPSQYVIGLMPFGSDNELDSSLGALQHDIYDISGVVTFSPDPSTGISGSGDFIFSAAAATVPLPAAVWLFCSGLLGLIGISRHNKTA